MVRMLSAGIYSFLPLGQKVIRKITDIINEEMADKKEIERSLFRIFKLIEQYQIKATFFEITTILAFDLFAKKNVDFAVIETGLGGRFDATNILNPILSVITSISLDHTKILGNSLEEIAFEKSGIIKENVPVFIGPTVEFAFIRKKISSLGCYFHKSKKIDGFYDYQNQEIAKDVLFFLQKKFSLKKEAIEKGLKKRPFCRFEVFSSENHFIADGKNLIKVPDIVLDVAHNVDAFEALFNAVKSKFNLKIRVVFGMSKDKDISSCSKVILKHASFVHLIDVSNDRLASRYDLSEHFPDNKVSYKETLEESLKKSLLLASKNNEVLVVCGSFFIMKDVTFFLKTHVN
jgi:dihydrofolate synthase/folylpolyglutamate synthase